jgi:hypothetical protein
MQRPLAFVLLVLATSCGSDEAPIEAQGVCREAYGALCGQSCVDGGVCPTGMRCAAGACTADCTPAAGCGPGQICGTNGTCISGAVLGGDGSTPFDPDAWGTGDGCINQNVGFEGQTPTVVLLVDQSGSMDGKYPNASSTNTRWTLLRDALMSKTNGVVFQMQSQVRFGLTTYTSHNGGASCPILTRVPIALDNYDAIDLAYQAAKPDTDTPTGAAVRATTTDLLAFVEPGAKYILLVTDGQPDTCDDPNPGDTAAQDKANQFTVQAAQDATQQGIGLFIVGVGSDIAPNHLQAMANAGVGLDPAAQPPSAAKYWVASDTQADLAGQIGSIVGNVRTCKFTLHGTVTSGYESQGVVVLDGVPLVYKDANGWKLDTPSQLEVLGTACDKIKSTSQQIAIHFPCEAFVPVR